MVKDFLDEDSAMSTQLTGKKLKDRGAVLAEIDGKLIEIDVEGPAQSQDIEFEQEYFEGREYGDRETKEEREERKRRELEVARQRNQETAKLEEAGKNQESPNDKLDKKETGIKQSQNEGRPALDSKAAQLQQNDAVDNLTQEQKQNLDSSVSARNVGAGKDKIHGVEL
ncbi:MAG: hypothetical protein COV36_05555 [Alphaproteobacteria bacterium CG11_big_fil_rev_8_21_14_0_20_44_7]|nr:MAG: hypothetical protein COV36_05555 [Alphaproteobacteria bacterium CG11_big_fil_rev_8_21_14_0_20_44_7]